MINHKPGNSRRQFLKNSTATVAGTTLAGSLTNLSATAHAAGSDWLKVGLVGCGGRGTGAALQALRADPHTKLVAVADAFQEKIDGSLKTLRQQEEVASRVTVDPSHQFVGLDSYQHVIDAVDVVLLCTPPGFRPVHFAAAVEAGKHIFTEKPMATDSAGIRSVIQSVRLSKDKGLSVVSGFCWRYSNPKRALFEKIHDGSIGDVRSVFGTYYTTPVKKMLPVESRPDGMSDLEWMVRNWYNFTWLSGDGLVEQACHTVDWVSWAYGDKVPVSCTAVGGRQIPSAGGNIFDHVEVNYLWDNGARGFVVHRQIDGCYGENQLYVLGTKGNGALTRHSQISDLTDQRVWKYDGSVNSMYQAEHDALFASIRSGNPVNHGDRMANSTMMAIMGRLAAYTGEKITWEMAINSQDTLVPAITDGWNTPVVSRKIAQPGTVRYV
ncbi:MAG: oxidoreductase [Planctomycetaceae bacterium]|nr:oxidoreductase [Planctomycetaceae bacterium]MBP63979.1 oxidoreductase [Planctomycetaceae bacterium]